MGGSRVSIYFNKDHNIDKYTEIKEKAFLSAWDKYSTKYNALSNKMHETGIDVLLLKEVLTTYQEYILLSSNCTTATTTDE